MQLVKRVCDCFSQHCSVLLHCTPDKQATLPLAKMVMVLQQPEGMDPDKLHVI